MSKNFKNKVKRKHVDWYDLMIEDNRPEVLAVFYSILQCGKIKSFNRIAYNALKSYYSTTAMIRARWTGSFL